MDRSYFDGLPGSVPSLGRFFSCWAGSTQMKSSRLTDQAGLGAFYLGKAQNKNRCSAGVGWAIFNLFPLFPGSSSEYSWGSSIPFKLYFYFTSRISTNIFDRDAIFPLGPAGAGSQSIKLWCSQFTSYYIGYVGLKGDFYSIQTYISPQVAN